MSMQPQSFILPQENIQSSDFVKTQLKSQNLQSSSSFQPGKNASSGQKQPSLFASTSSRRAFQDVKNVGSNSKDRGGTPLTPFLKKPSAQHRRCVDLDTFQKANEQHSTNERDQASTNVSAAIAPKHCIVEEDEEEPDTCNYAPLTNEDYQLMELPREYRLSQLPPRQFDAIVNGGLPLGYSCDLDSTNYFADIERELEEEAKKFDAEAAAANLSELEREVLQFTFDDV